MKGFCDLCKTNKTAPNVEVFPVDMVASNNNYVVQKMNLCGECILTKKFMYVDENNVVKFNRVEEKKSFESPLAKNLGIPGIVQTI